VTFLFTDIEGSTRLWQADETAMRAAVARHDELLRGIMREHGGDVFSTMGDGLAAAFPSAPSGVAAALTAQDALAAEAWPGSVAIRVRMGLHTGEAERRDGDYFGSAVNRAARLMAVGSGGQVLCSAATAGLLEPGVALVDLGEHRLRDLERPMHVFQMGGGSFPHLRSLDAFPGNLPPQRTSFIGRTGVLGTVVGALKTTRLVTLTGTGGVGKTRLALQAAAEASPAYPDGAWFCELAAAADPDAMLQVVAVALGVTPRHDVPLGRAIADFIGQRRLLVVLDNCEHLLDTAADFVDTVMADCRHLRVLATSREALDVGGERVLRLRSLAVPAQGADLDEVGASEAARLFIERAEAAGAELVLESGNAVAIGEICRRLDGIPLAIELAAARVTALTPSEIAAHLDERFRLLTGGRRAAVERHHTMRAAVDWSYSLLDEAEQRVFERLGVFPAAFDAAAAKAVASGGGIDDWGVMEALTSLVSKSMLVAERTAAESTSYQMLETLRHYAREHLEASGEADERRRRHARHYLSVAEEINAGVRGREQAVWQNRLRADLDDFRAAVFWGLEAASAADADVALGIIVNLGVTSNMGAGGVSSWAQQAVERARTGDPRYLGPILAHAAVDAFTRGEFRAGRHLSQEALSAPVEATLSARTVFISAAIFSPPDALDGLLDEGVRRLQQSEHREWDIAYLRSSLAGMAAIGGRHDLAQREASAGLEVARRLHAPWISANALYPLALSRYSSEPAAALAALDEYFEVIQAGIGDHALARCLALSAVVRTSLGDRTRRVDELRQAIEVAHRTGDRPAMAFVLARMILVVRDDDAGTAATLAGVISTGVLSRQFGVLAWERHAFEAAIEEIKAALGEEKHLESLARGGALSYDEAVAFATGALVALLGE
jgi:predicted ATPase